MNIEDIKERLKSDWNEFSSRLEDSPAFNSIKEKYETLNPNVQKGITWAGIFCVTFFLLSCPYGYWSTSVDNVAIYEENRQMIRELLRASHISNQTGQLPSDIPIGQLISMVQNRLRESGLLTEQIADVSPLSASELGQSLAPKDIAQEALQISLKKLNLKQVVDLSYKMQMIHESVKLAGVDVKATAADDHYFDVLLQLVKFSLPKEEPPPPDKKRNKRKKRGNNG